MGMHRVNRRAQNTAPVSTVYARHIGRVGALAVALGVGMAVATTPGVAFADDTVNAADDNPVAQPTPNTPQAENNDPPAGGDGTPTGNTTTTTTTTGVSGSTTVIGGGSTPQVTIGSSGGAVTSGTTTTDPDPTSTPPVDPTTAAPTSTIAPPVTPTPTVTVDPTTAAPSPNAAPTTAAPQPAAAGASPTAMTATGVPPATTGTPPVTGTPTARTLARQAKLADDTSNTVQLNALAAPAAVPVPAPVQPQQTLAEAIVALPGTIISTALNLITQALAPLVGPGAPADNPVLWAVLAFVRRQFNQTFANSTPVLAPQQTSQDLGVIRGTFGATDADGDTLTYTVPTTGLGAPTHGDVTINHAAGTWTYTPDTGYTGQDYFYVTATDDTAGGHIHALGQTHATTAAVTVTVGPTAPTNTAPVATNDSFTVIEDTPRTGNVLANDTDANNNDTLTAILVSGPTNATGFALNPNGTFTYTPAANSVTPDSFTYKVNDGTTDGNTATVTLTVTAVNDAPFLDVTTEPTGAPNGAIKITITYGDVDGDTPLTSNLSTPLHGYYAETINGPDVTAGIVGERSVDASTGGQTNVAYYIPDPSRAGLETLTFTLTDATGATVTKTATITVDAPPNAAPTITLSTEPTGLPNGAIKVTLVYGDTDGDPLTLTIGALQYGGYFRTADGQGPIPTGDIVNPNNTDPAGYTTPIYYVPNQSGYGTETLSFTVKDDSGATVTTTTGIVVSAPPVNPTNPVTVNNDADSTTGAVTGQINLNPAAGTPTFAVTNAPTKGSVVINANGSFTYTPDPIERVRASVTDGNDTDAFIVTVASNNASVQVRIAVSVDPTGAAITQTATKTVDTGYAGIVRGSDGTAVISERKGTGTVTDPFLTELTVLRPDGTRQIVVVGGVTDAFPPDIAADGTLFQTSSMGNGTAQSPYFTTVTVLRPDGTVESVRIAGQPVGTAQAYVNGTARQTTRTAAGQTMVNVIQNGESYVLAPIAGAPYGGVRMGADHTYAQLAILPSGELYLTVIRPGGASFAFVNGVPYGQVEVGDDGTVAFASYTGTGTATDPYKSTVTIVRPDGSQTSHVADGRTLLPNPVRVGPDGTVSLTTGTYVPNSLLPYQTTVTVLRPDGSSDSAFDSSAFISQVEFGINGTVAVTTGSTQNMTTGQTGTNVSVIRPDGTQAYLQSDLVVQSSTGPAQVGGDGTVAVATNVGRGTAASPYRAHITVQRADGEEETFAISGRAIGSPRIDSEGSISVATYVFGSANSADAFRTTLTRFNSDGTVDSATTAGYPHGGVQLGPDGRVYITTSDQRGTTVVIMDHDGSYSSVTAVGTPFTGELSFNSNNTVSLTTYTGEGTVDDFLILHFTTIAVAQSPAIEM